MRQSLQKRLHERGLASKVRQPGCSLSQSGRGASARRVGVLIFNVRNESADCVVLCVGDSDGKSWFLSSRSSDRMLRWTGKSLPAAGLLPLASRQHDRRALWRSGRLRSRLRGCRPVHLQRQRYRGWRVPASAPPLHRPRPPPGGPIHGHGGRDEASPPEPRGRARLHPALVLLRKAADRQTALGPAQHLQGLCRAGHPQPAASTWSRVHTGTHARSPWTCGSGDGAAGAHAGGELGISGPEEGEKGRDQRTLTFFFHLLFSRYCCWGVVCKKKLAVQEQNDSGWEKLLVLILHIGILTFLKSFYLQGNQQKRKKKTQPRDGFAALVFSVSVFFHLHFSTVWSEDTGLFRVVTP